ncbi:nickel pincer cofactor-dependent isomerase, group 22 [Natronorarus salvus]|uniref:DUF362 domain-containing protein n=1 Tax=Natronorarus salvus TaxID=3117733 RepID=UPI002F265039
MEFPDRSQVADLLEPKPFPEFARVRYDPPTETVSDVHGTTRSELDQLPLSELDPGATVAVGVGSRGIHAIDEVATAVVAGLRDRGLEPVLVPAMGSHGGATPAGQREVLEVLGITEERVGAPIDARMDAEQVGEVDVRGTTMAVYVAEAALEADALLPINRVKPHTNFGGRIESGLCKMAVVGFGKQHGARAFHSTAIDRGYVPTLEAALSRLREAVPLVGGIALVENFHEETALVEAIPGDEFEEREPALLERAKAEMATLPTDEIDLLVVDELGKEVSGAGMDTNVIGRYRVLNAPDPETPAIDLIYARGLTEGTKGNGNGIGLADITRKAAIDQLDLQKTYANALTSGSLAKAQLPVVAPDDELALRIALNSLGGYDAETVRVVWIENTTDLAELRISEALVPELSERTSVLDRERLAFEDGEVRFVPA